MNHSNQSGDLPDYKLVIWFCFFFFFIRLTKKDFVLLIFILCDKILCGTRISNNVLFTFFNKTRILLIAVISLLIKGITQGKKEPQTYQVLSFQIAEERIGRTAPKKWHLVMCHSSSKKSPNTFICFSINTQIK